MHIEQAITTSIEAIFILLGDTAIYHWKTPDSSNKIKGTLINWMNRLLGVEINTRSFAIRTPIDYVEGTVLMLNTKWHNNKHTWFALNTNSLTGRLCHIAKTSPWLHFLVSYLNIFITFALGEVNTHLINTRKDFRDMLRLAKGCWVKAGTYFTDKKEKKNPPRKDKRYITCSVKIVKADIHTNPG